MPEMCIAGYFLACTMEIPVELKLVGADLEKGSSCYKL